MESQNHYRHSADHVDFDDPAVVANWMKSLGVREEMLRKAVEEVGNDFGRVYDYVLKHRQH